jgi:hypothetical protein
METAATGAATTAAGAPTTALGVGADGIAFATAWEGCGCWSVLVVTVVCGVVRAGFVCVARPCCFVRGSRAKVHQKLGKPRHIGDRRKARDETSQTITFN